MKEFQKKLAELEIEAEHLLLARNEVIQINCNSRTKSFKAK